jgi:hypothetical protein
MSSGEERRTAYGGVDQEKRWSSLVGWSYDHNKVWYPSLLLIIIALVIVLVFVSWTVFCQKHFYNDIEGKVRSASVMLNKRIFVRTVLNREFQYMYNIVITFLT